MSNATSAKSSGNFLFAFDPVAHTNLAVLFKKNLMSGEPYSTSGESTSGSILYGICMAFALLWILIWVTYAICVLRKFKDTEARKDDVEASYFSTTKVSESAQNENLLEKEWEYLVTEESFNAFIKDDSDKIDFVWQMFTVEIASSFKMWYFSIILW